MEIFGNYTALITPFTKSGKIDYNALEDLLFYQKAYKTDGIVLFGSTGEGHTLKQEEKENILKFVKEQTFNSIPIIVSILSYSTSDCLKEISHFENLGADAFLISVPPYIKPTQTGIKNHFITLANHSLKPIIIYNIKSRTGVNIDFETLKELSKHKNIIGIKEASTCFSDIVKTCSLISNNFKVLAGNDNFILPMLSCGASGAVSVVGNLMPDFVHNIFEAFKTSPEFSKHLFYEYEQLIDCLSLETNPIPIKYLLSKTTVVKAVYRKPLCPPSLKTKKQINKILDKIIKL